MFLLMVSGETKNASPLFLPGVRRNIRPTVPPLFALRRTCVHYNGWARPGHPGRLGSGRVRVSHRALAPYAPLSEWFRRVLLRPCHFDRSSISPEQEIVKGLRLRGPLADGNRSPLAHNRVRLTGKNQVVHILLRGCGGCRFVFLHLDRSSHIYFAHTDQYMRRGGTR